MKSLLISISSLFFLTGCTQQSKPEIKIVAAKTDIAENVVESNLYEASFSISGMMCKMGCAKTIETNLSKMEGVQQASVDFETSFATVLYNSSVLQTDDLVQTVTDTGDSYMVSQMASSPNAKRACCAKDGCKKANCAKKKS